MRKSNHSSLRDRFVRNKGTLYFGGGEPMRGHIDDIVNAAQQPVEAVFVKPATVPGQILAGESGKIDVLDQLIFAISKHAPDHAGPGLGNYQIASLADSGGGTVLLQYFWFDPKEWFGGRARLSGHGSG